MADCDSISDCVACITSVMHCFFILTGIGDSASWSCVPSVAGLSGVRMTVTVETSEFCPTKIPPVSTSNEIVTYLSFALAVFCVIGICAMAYWARTQRRTSIPPSQPPPLPPRPANFAREAIVAISTFAQRRQEERDRSREAFNRRNAEFQRELAERLEAVRIRREAAYPGTPRNTPEPHCSFVATLPRLSREPSLAPTTRQASPAPSVPSRSTTPAPILPPRSITPAPSVPSRSTTPPPTTHRSSSFTSTPTMHRSREATPSLPGIDVSPVPSPAQSEHLYDSPADTIYESIDNSPVDSPPQLPSTPERRSRFGRLLKRPSFFKCMW